MTGNLIEVSIRSIRDEARQIRSFELVPLPGQCLPAWQPGAHIRVTLACGLQRTYSLCSLPGERRSYRIAVRHDPQGRGATAMHALTPGERLWVSEPVNDFTLDPTASRHLLIAGGIGITPLLSMFFSLEQAGQNAALHYFARSHAEAAFLDELEAARRRGRVHCHFGLQAAAAAARLQSLFADDVARPLQGRGLALYLSAPPGLMAALERATRMNALTHCPIYKTCFSPGSQQTGSHSDTLGEPIFASPGVGARNAPTRHAP